ncbi:MAG: DMT family transporter [Alicyclobacillaceae bacterium]|uniref:DMT family transporter n=1 Tax=Alicyclobacillus sp. SP_1 TaxID=2942475 RepID=UPI0021581E29|nr:DMT family transporter [Alicyclobacillus sp. SP_1]MCY0896024.1 DMT family transporter [Alicyclobacillaceae bacterium]
MRTWPVLALLLVAMMWGGHAVVGKAVEAQMSPTVLTFWRFFFGALCYAPWWGRFRNLWKWSGRLKLQLVGAALCSSVIYPLFYYSALRTLSPVASLLFVNTAPLIAAILSRVLYKERIGLLGYVGMLISFCGVLVLVASEWAGHLSAHGIVFVLIGTVAFATYTVLSRPLFAHAGLFDVLVGTSVLGSVMLFFIVPFLVSPHKMWTQLTSLTMGGWLEFAYVVVIVSTVAYVLYGFGLRRLPSGIAAALTFYPQALFGALLQWLWLGIRPTVTLAIAGLFILGGTAVLRLAEHRRSSAAAHVNSDAKVV